MMVATAAKEAERGNAREARTTCGQVGVDGAVNEAAVDRQEQVGCRLFGAGAGGGKQTVWKGKDGVSSTSQLPVAISRE